VPYDTIWRTGANAATVLTLNDALSIGGQHTPAGSYSLWTMPKADGVQLILNGQHGQWGTEHDASKDLYRIPLKVSQTNSAQETFVIDITPDFELRFRWSTFIWSAHLSRP
jgi:hypothetical protein